MSTCEENKQKKFSKSWLSNDKYKLWIKEVPNNEFQFYCIYCDEYLSCSSSHVERHNKSKKHESMFGEGSKKKNEKKFLRVWLESLEFQPWLEEIPNDPYKFKCNICDVQCMAGLSQIRRHKSSKMHIDACVNKNIDLNDHTLQTNEETISLDERTAEAEIKFASLVAEVNLPFHLADKLLKFFQNVAKDPLVLQSMTMGRTKTSKIISNVLSPVNTERVVESIKNTKFSIFIDETSDVTNDKWMTVLVKYVNDLDQNTRTELLSMLNLDASDCSADKIFESFKTELIKYQIPLINISALSSDNASVMMGNTSSFKTKLLQFCPKLLSLPCPCHSVALVAHAACAKLPPNVEELLKKIPSFLNNSPKRNAIFKDLQLALCSKTSKIKKYCETRWLSRHESVQTILDNWDVLILFFQESFVSDKLKTAENLLLSMNDPETKAFFLFLDYVLDIFNKFNLSFQATETKIHLLQSSSKKLLQEIAENFIIDSKLKQMDFINIDFSLKINQKKLTDISLGSEADLYLQTCFNETEVNIVESIKEKCLSFYITAAEKIREKLPINNEFLASLNCLNAEIALFADNRVESFEKVKFIANTLDTFDEDGLKREWFNLFTDFSLEEKKQLSACSFDDMWKKILLTEQHGTIKYPHFRKLLSIVRSLPNSNADAERSFSTLADVKTKKRNKLSATNVNSVCVVKSGLKATGVNSQTMSVSSSHLSLMSSENLYKSNDKKKPKLNLQNSDCPEKMDCC